MAYCSAQDLIDLRIASEAELIALSDDDGAGIVDTTVVEAAAEQASLEVDAHLAGVVAAPLAEAPSLIKRLAAILTFFHLHPDPTDHATEQYRRALGTLRQIRSGEIPLAADGELATRDDSLQWGETSERVWGRPQNGGLR